MENLSVKKRLNSEIDRILVLCSQISQLVQTIQKIPLRKETIEFEREEILSIFEQVDGAALLLESLLHGQEQYLKTRISYDRETLLKLRQSVSKELSNDKRKILRDVVHYEIERTIRQNKNWKYHLQSILL